MIIIKNRELMIPGNERFIGTPLDNETDIRQFRMDRFSQNGFDLSNLTFRLDMKYPETRKVYTFSATTSRSGRSVVVMTQHYTAAYPNAGTKTFTFNGTKWNDGSQDVDLAKIGVSIAFTPNNGDTITVVTTTANVDTDTVLLTKEIHDDYFVLTWEITANQTAVPGTVFANLRGSDENGDQRYASFPGVFYSEKNIYSPANYGGSLSELEQLENQLVSALRRAEYLSQDYEDLEEAVEDAEAWANGTRGGVAVDSGDQAYHNNSKYYRMYAERFAKGTENGAAVSSGDGYLDNAHYWKQQGERYAVGKEDGTDVASGTGYHDNSKYYKELADDHRKTAEAYAKGTVDGTAVTSGQTGYQDNAKYYKEQVQSRLNQIDTNTSNIAVQTARIDQFTHLAEGSTTGDAELMDARVGADGVTYASAGAATRANDSLLKSQIDNTNKVLTLSKNTLEMEWEEGSITMNGTKVASTAHRRTAYCIRLLKGSQLICSDGVKVRVITFTMVYPSYITVVDTATDYTTSYTANSDQYAMFAINSTDISKIAIVAPYQYRRIYTTISQELWSEGTIDTGGNIVTATGRYYTLPFYVGKGTYIECVGATRCRVICYDTFDIDRRSKIAISDDWVGFYTVPQNCFIQIVLAAQYDADSITTADLNKLHCNLIPAEHQDMRIQWELGGITLATGTDNTSTYRYRTLFFRAKAGDFISCRSGYTMVVYEYSREHPQNMRLVTSQSSWTSSYIVRTDCICRLAVKKDDGTEVVISNLQTMITMTSSASGNRLLNAKKTFNVPYTPYKSAGLVSGGVWSVTYTDVYGWYNALVDDDYVTKETLGNDASGTYSIYAYRFKPSAVISSVVAQDSATVIPVRAYPIKFLLCTATHGSERPSVLALYNAMYNIVNNWQNDPVLEFIRHNCEIVVVPLVNPYGFINRTRGNVNGVDINRNYNTNSWQYGASDTSSPYYRGASAGSENETKHMQNLIMREPFDFVYDFHTHGNFTAYDQMFCWASCGQGYEQYTFEIGQAVTKSSNSGAIKNHGFDADKMIGRNEVYSNYAMIADFADKFSFVSASPEVAYKIYDGSGSTNSDTELTDAVKSVNEEYIINSIIISANTMH